MMGRYQSERRRLGLEFLEPRQVLSASGISSDFVIGINHTEICRLDESMSVALGNLDPAEEQLTNSLNQTLSRYLNRIRSRLSATTPVQTESDQATFCSLSERHRYNTNRPTGSALRRQ